MYRVLLVYIGDLKQQYLLFYCVYVCVCVFGFFFQEIPLQRKIFESQIQIAIVCLCCTNPTYKYTTVISRRQVLYQYYRRSRVWTYIIVLVFLLYCGGGGVTEFRTLNKRVHAFLFLFCKYCRSKQKIFLGFLQE